MIKLLIFIIINFFFPFWKGTKGIQTIYNHIVWIEFCSFACSRQVEQVARIESAS